MNGTITKKPRGGGKFSWGYTFFAGRDQNGKRIQPTKSGFPTKAEASAALRKAIEKFEAERDAVPAPAPKEIPAFADFFSRWMSEYAERNCQPKTIERYSELGAYAIGHPG